MGTENETSVMEHENNGTENTESGAAGGALETNVKESTTSTEQSNEEMTS